MLAAMSRIILKLDFARLTSVAQIRRNWICLPLLTMAMPLCWSSLLQAQQKDHSVLVFDGSRSSAGSNDQVDLETEFQQATDSTFNTVDNATPATTQPYLPPSPPSSMTSSESAVSFRRPGLDNGESVQTTSATMMSPDSGTFTSRLPGDGRSTSDSGLQVDNTFGSSPASPNLRANAVNNSSRNRFGDFGESPTRPAANRFTPVSSNQNFENQKNSALSPTQPARERVESPAVVAASAEQPVTPTAGASRFNVSTPAPSQQFPQPPLPKAAPTEPSRLSASQPIPTRSVSPPSNLPRPTQPGSQSAVSSSPSQARQFPKAPGRFASPESTSSRQTGSGQSSTFEGSSSNGASNANRDLSSSRKSDLRATSNSGSRDIFSGGAGIRSERPSTPTNQRQPNASSFSSFPSSSSTSQANSGSSRLTSQTSSSPSQFGQQALRGQVTNNNNDLRNNPSGVQSLQTQRSTNQSQSSGKADRNSIKFAQQQLRNIQPTSANANGTPVRLQELFLEPLTGSQRKLMVAQYWETYYDLAALKIAGDYEAWLKSISTSGSEQGLLATAQRMAADQQLAAKIQLGKSQSRLLDFMPNRRPNEFAPLPADEPLIEHYVTDYEKYERVRSLPTSLRGIDPMLASTLKLITQRAETVSIAKNAADQAGRSVRNQQMPLASAIAAGQLWREAQMDMIASTVSYNQAISDFVLTLEGNRSPEQLTAFMLGAPKNNEQSNTTPPQNQTSRSAANQRGFSSNRQQFR